LIAPLQTLSKKYLIACQPKEVVQFNLIFETLHPFASAFTSIFRVTQNRRWMNHAGLTRNPVRPDGRSDTRLAAFSASNNTSTASQSR
jgi:hypothetical protein